MVIWLPFAVLGILAVAREKAVTPIGLGYLAAGTAAGWVALCLFGFWGNRGMRRVLEARLKEKGERWFVGFASPKYAGLLDAHEDIGFLVMGDRNLTFVGDSLRVELPRDNVVRVTYRANAHTAVGLGRWVCVEGIAKGQPVRMMVEPRERSTMLGNLLLSKKLRAEIEAWMKQ